MHSSFTPFALVHIECYFLRYMSGLASQKLARPAKAHRSTRGDGEWLPRKQKRAAKDCGQSKRI